MKCPVCKEVNLVMSDRQGVEIDYCPECRGVWLDRGELDKIIERSAMAAPQAVPQAPPQAQRYGGEYEKKHGDDYPKHKKSKGSLLGELFDF